jgi:hypothetical protein
MSPRPNHSWREVRRPLPLTVEAQPSTASIMVGRVTITLMVMLFLLIPGRVIFHLIGLA